MPRLSLFIFLALTILYPPKAKAAKILRVKDKFVLIQLYEKDKKFFKAKRVFGLYNKNGAKQGRLVIAKVKGSKAMGKVIEGGARHSFVLRPEKKGKSYIKGRDIYFGVMTGMTLNTMQIATGLTTNSLTGTGLILKGLYDLPLWKSIWLRATAGLKQFSASSNCIQCEVNISYLTGDGYIRYMFNKASNRYWIGGGISFLYPISNDSTAVDNVAATNNYLLAAGYDFILNKKMIIPMMIEYAGFPAGSSNTTYNISLKLGFGYSF